MSRLPFISFLLLILAFSSCDKGRLHENQAPETKLFVGKIELTGDDRLTSNVNLHWDGTDVDGYVKGFEISFDQNNWDFVTTNDSVFIFTIPPGADTFDYDFWVRAVDDQDLRDPTPAYLQVPVKNTAPTVLFDSIFVMPDTSFFVFSIKWNADDKDGFDNIDSVALKLNNGSWVNVDPFNTFATFVAQDPTGSGSSLADIYLGISANPHSDPIDDLILAGDNQVMIRVKDQSGTYSDIDTTKIIHIKNKTADLLVIDSYKSGGNSPEQIYLPILNGLSGSYDYIDIESNNGANLPAPVNPTFGFVLNEYERVFWYSDASAKDDGVQETDDEMYIELAAGVILQYLNQGGKLFMTARLPLTFENTSAVFDYSPMDSVSSADGQARIMQGQLQSPYGTYASTYDTLESNTFITGAQPFYPIDSSNIMFTTELTPVLNWTGPNIVAAKSTFAGNTNLVFMSIALHELNGRPASISTFITNVLETEFNW